MNGNETPIGMIYPCFNLFSDGTVVPRIHLPNNYLEIVPQFYEAGRKEKIEDYAKRLDTLRKRMSVLELSLAWDEFKGLVHITSGRSGLDLNDRYPPCFNEHNLGGNVSFILGMVAMKYVHDLVKINEISNQNKYKK